MVQQLMQDATTEWSDRQESGRPFGTLRNTDCTGVCHLGATALAYQRAHTHQSVPIVSRSRGLLAPCLGLHTQ
eukprot:4073389-Amphidinium_carterae.1